MSMVSSNARILQFRVPSSRIKFSFFRQMQYASECRHDLAQRLRQSSLILVFEHGI